MIESRLDKDGLTQVWSPVVSPIPGIEYRAGTLVQVEIS